MKLGDEDQASIDAERGYSVRGEREVRIREWFSLREDGEGPKDFARLVSRLRARKYWRHKPPERKARIFAYRKQWAKDNRDIVRASASKSKRRRRQLRTPGFVREEKARREQRRRELIARHAAAVFVCTVCGAAWCSAPWVELPKAFMPKYCTQKCRSRAGYLRNRAAGKWYATGNSRTRTRPTEVAHVLD